MIWSALETSLGMMVTSTHFELSSFVCGDVICLPIHMFILRTINLHLPSREEYFTQQTISYTICPTFFIFVTRSAPATLLTINKTQIWCVSFRRFCATFLLLELVFDDTKYVLKIFKYRYSSTEYTDFVAPPPHKCIRYFASEILEICHGIIFL